MTNKNQFKASFKKEWLEIVRTKKLIAYFILAFGYLIMNFLTTIVFPVGIFNGSTIELGNLYTFQSSLNKFLLGLNLIIVLFLNRNVVTKELSDKKLALPLSLGLKASINITSKMILQTIVPAVIAVLASTANGLFGIVFLQNVAVSVPVFGIVTVSFSSIMMSALCVFISIQLFMMLLVSFQALVRNANISLIMTLVILLLCDNFASVTGAMTFSPVAFFSFGIFLASTSTTSQIVLSTLVIASTVFLITIAGALVYTDRNDFAI